MSESKNIVDLKEHLLQIIQEREAKYEIRFLSIERGLTKSAQEAKEAISMAAENIKDATCKSEAAMEKRLNSLNEFRGQMGDMQTTFARRGEVDIRMDALDGKIDLVNAQLHRTTGRDTGLHSAWVVIAAIAALVIAALGIWLK